MAAAQFRWHEAYDRNQPVVSFTVGDHVLLDTRNLDVRHMGTTGKRKRAARYIDPYRILKIAGPDTYTLELPPGLRLHSDYHVFRFRQYHRDHDPQRTTRVQPVLVADGSEGHLVSEILHHRCHHGVQQFNVRWLDSSIKPSWEPLGNLVQVLALVHSPTSFYNRARDKCLVTPGDSTEFLLGNDLLTTLGIDMLRQLDMLVAHAMRGERDDEFDDADEPLIGSSASLSAAVLAAVVNMIERAVEKGFPTELVTTLRRIATRFDLWRLRLVDDTPARVPPMKVRLKPGAKL
ncbi:unnamed protein product [Phytophthora fragariaefolia]|uniref:Unnamed protein product n=1 Tax=Phytophthora fragariaefolia TaxID=1490495 RepID=A0A9W6XPW1_9STRA|nr:unnamed protein product [Phytophthora fragariaefolia]